MAAAAAEVAVAAVLPVEVAVAAVVPVEEALAAAAMWLQQVPRAASAQVALAMWMLHVQRHEPAEIFASAGYPCWKQQVARCQPPFRGGVRAGSAARDGTKPQAYYRREAATLPQRFTLAAAGDGLRSGQRGICTKGCRKTQHGQFIFNESIADRSSASRKTHSKLCFISSNVTKTPSLLEEALHSGERSGTRKLDAEPH